MRTLSTLTGALSFLSKGISIKPFMNQFDGLILRRVEIYTDRVLAILHAANLVVQKLTKHNDAAIGFA